MKMAMLCKRSDGHHVTVPKIAAACCILHNFCEIEKEVINQQWTKEVEELERMFPQPVCQTCRTVVNNSYDIRDVLKGYLARNFVSRRLPIIALTLYKWFLSYQLNCNPIPHCIGPNCKVLRYNSK